MTIDLNWSTDPAARHVAPHDRSRDAGARPDLRFRTSVDRGHWRAFVAKLAKFDATPFDLGAENVRALACPVLIIKGDNDGVELTHIAEMYKLLGGDRMADTAGLPRSRLAVSPRHDACRRDGRQRAASGPDQRVP
jgi:hypothetical protein